MKHSAAGFVTLAILAAVPVLALTNDRLWERYDEAGHSESKKGHYAEAEENFRAAADRAEQLHSSSLSLKSYHDLAMLMYSSGRYIQAEPAFKKAIAISDKAIDAFKKPGEEVNFRKACDNEIDELAALADCYRAEAKYKKAEALYRFALKDEDIEKQVGTVPYAHLQSELADVLTLEQKYTEAEMLYKTAMPIFEKADAHELLLDLLEDYDAYLHVTNHLDEAKKLEARYESIAGEPMVEAADSHLGK